MLTLRGIGKRYPNGLVALENIDLDVLSGAFTSIVGPSGCGKSTLLRIVAGLARPSEGELSGRPDGAVGLVFQDANLMPWADVWSNVYLPLHLGRLSRRQAGPRVEEALSLVGLQDFLHVYPNALSGGMRMRVAIARALVTRPRLLLMDEPFAALDEITRMKLNDDLLALWREGGFSVVFVTHSVFESVYLSTHVAVMTPRPGRIFAEHEILGPAIRDRAFRVSQSYLLACKAISADLEAAVTT